MKELEVSKETVINTSRVVLETIQWTRLQQIEDLKPISDDDYEVLKGVARSSLAAGLSGSFRNLPPSQAF
jgi:hypothetical protein